MTMEPEKITAKAVCVIIRNGKEILATLGHDPVKGETFGRLIGGSVEFGETSFKAIHRELKEELGTGLENLIFLRVIENIFTYNGKRGHQITFLYKGDLVDKGMYTKEHLVILDDPKVKVAWIPLDDVRKGKMILYPKLDYKELI